MENRDKISPESGDPTFNPPESQYTTGGSFTPLGNEGLGETAESKLASVKNRVREQVDLAKQQAKSTLTEKSSRMADDVAHSLDDFSDTLRNSADQVIQRQHEVVGRYMQSAAQQLEVASRTLREKDFGYMLQRTQDAARRYPEAFLSGAVTLGFFLGRFLKSSASHETRGFGEPEAFEEDLDEESGLGRGRGESRSPGDYTSGI